MARSSSNTTPESDRAAYWREVSGEWETSGLTQAEFCSQRKLSLSALRWWRWHLSKRDGQTARQKFLPVRLIAAPDEKEGSSVTGPAFEIMLNRDLLVRVPQNFEEQALRRLLKVLEESTC